MTKKNIDLNRTTNSALVEDEEVFRLMDANDNGAISGKEFLAIEGVNVADLMKDLRELCSMVQKKFNSFENAFESFEECADGEIKLDAFVKVWDDISGAKNKK